MLIDCLGLKRLKPTGSGPCQPELPSVLFSCHELGAGRTSYTFLLKLPLTNIKKKQIKRQEPKTTWNKTLEQSKLDVDWCSEDAFKLKHNWRRKLEYFVTIAINVFFWFSLRSCKIEYCFWYQRQRHKASVTFGKQSFLSYNYSLFKFSKLSLVYRLHLIVLIFKKNHDIISPSHSKYHS